MNDSNQTIVCGKLHYYQHHHPKRDHIYAVKQSSANHNTPTSMSLSSQTFAQKCTVEQNHNHYLHQQRDQAVQKQADHSFRNSELTSVVIHQESSNRIISDDNEDVIVVSPQNGTLAHLQAAEAAKQRRLSESDVFTQKAQPQSMAHFLEAARSDVCLSQPAASRQHGPMKNNEKQPRGIIIITKSQMEAAGAETKSLA